MSVEDFELRLRAEAVAKSDLLLRRENSLEKKPGFLPRGNVLQLPPFESGGAGGSFLLSGDSDGERMIMI